MEQFVGTYQLSVQQNIAPAPNESPKAVDWLPKFAGFSWLAYGAHFSVVITMAPSPSNTGEVAMGGFFRQVLSTNWPKEDQEEKPSVSSVAWAPRGLSIGSLAAAAGKNLYLYVPKGLNCDDEGNQDSPELPLRWVKTHVLEHSSDVVSFSWSESGDGLFSVGLEMVMWQKNKSSWNCLWRSQLERPQFLSAASWSARGIAATADGPSVPESQANDGDHLVKVWWLEEGEELLEVELTHPDQLLMIQWRPMRGFGSSSQSFRPVLLTCCRDGVVRLWAEIGNLGFPEAGNSGLADVVTANPTDKAENGNENQFKFAFFVSAVIDANSTLRGTLGKTIHITWPEGRGGGVRSSSGEPDESSSSSLVNKDSEVAMNEWLIGIGPSGSITLWSVQSLDDLSPARGPLIQLWHQRSGTLPLPSPPFSQGGNFGVKAQNSPHAVKVVVHRPHGTFWGPPSSLDVFEVWSPHLLRWSCVWPPVAAIGGPSSKSIAPSSSGAASMIAAGGKMSAWGVSSEIVVLDGHDGEIVQIAVHPVAAVRLAASLDDQGTILLWESKGSSSNLRSEVGGCLNPLWRHSGQLTGNRVCCSRLFNSMAWAPLVLPKDDTVLLLCHSHGVDCILLSKNIAVSKSKSKSFSISHTLLYTLDWPVTDDKYGLQGIYMVPSHLTVIDSPYIKNCIAVGVGSNGSKLASWKLEIQLHENEKDGERSSQNLQESEETEEINVDVEPSESSATAGGDAIDSQEVVPHDDIAKPQDGAIQDILFDVCLLGVLNLGTREEVTSIATATSEHLLGGHSGRLRDFSEVCNIVTGGADGVLRLWKVWDGISANSLLSLEKAGAWHCVGLLRCYSSAVSKVALCSGTSKIASTGAETSEVIDIWGADTFIEKRGFCLEGRVRLSSPAVSVRWFDGGNGSSVLGVISQRDVQLFAECRQQLSRSGLSEAGLWTCLASLPATGFSASTLSWEAQGSLIITFGGHIILYSNCVLRQTSYGSVAAGSDARRALTSGEGQASNARGISTYEALRTLGNGNYVQSGVRLDEDEKSNQAKGLCSIVEAAERIGCPLLDYYPTSLLTWISGGSRENARASIRHLASFLLALSSSSNCGGHRNNSEPVWEQPKSKVPRTPLSEIFQEREQLSALQGQSEIGNLTTSSKTSFLDFTSKFNSGYGDGEDQKSGVEPTSVVKKGGLELFTKTEVEIISAMVKDSVTIPGLSADGKLQLLAVIDVLSEMDGVNTPSKIDGIDFPGQRFWLAFRYSVLYAKWKNDGSDTRMVAMESKAMAWALQSEFKENLLGLCLPDQNISWPALRALGMGYWFTDGAELRKMMEKLARAQFLQRKDPNDCALLYLALDRRSVLAGLFKLSRDQKDRPLTEFLFRDFKDEKHRVAALKNAYVLMGKHRHELAATFFILGGDINSAAKICAKNLNDPQLALVICSLMEGVNGPIGQDIILKYALPIARDTRDSWLASMLQWLLGKGIESIQELIERGDNQSTSPPETSSKGYLEGSETPPQFPLDPDLGRYCELVASKPRVRNSISAREACALAAIATTRSAAAMKRTGLALQALEYLRGGKAINFTDSDRELATDSFSATGSGTADTSKPSSLSDFPLTDIRGRQIGSGWMSKGVVTGIGRATTFSLVLQCASQLLQDHPNWGGQTCSAWQDPVLSGILLQTESEGKIGSSTGHNDESTVSNTSAKPTGVSTYMEAADKLYDDDLKILEKKYSVNVDGVVAALSTYSRIHHRPYLRHRLVRGLRSFTNAPDLGFHLASQFEMSISAAQYLEAFGTEAPLVLAWTVLSCGIAAAAQLGNSEASRIRDRETTPAQNGGPAKGGALPKFSFEEVVRFGGEIQLLSKAANQDQSPSLAGKERRTRAVSLLSFISFVAAAWLGRQTKALFTLIAPTVIDPSTAPEVPQGELDAVVWFRRLESDGKTLHRPGKKPVEPVAFNMAGNVTIPSDDAWRVLGVSLWNHLLIYVRKQLTGIASEASYRGFGRVSSAEPQNGAKSSFLSLTSQSQASSVLSNSKGGATFLGFSLQSSALSSTWLDFKSKVRDSYQSLPSRPATTDGGGSLQEGGPIASSTTGTDDFEVALLGALTSVVAGLRKQLAAHMEHSVTKSEADALTLWLWGRPSPPVAATKKPTTGSSALSFFNASSSSNGQGGVSATSCVTVYSQSQPNLFPTGVLGTADKELKDLWELLVVREKVCSALGLEGVSGQRRKRENDHVCGWYSGRRGGQVNAADNPEAAAAGTAAGRGVNTVCRVPPKRIMWNDAVKGVSSPQSDPGVTLSSRREEQNSQSRSQASEDRLHLSEEFSERLRETDLSHIPYPEESGRDPVLIKEVITLLSGVVRAFSNAPDQLVITPTVRTMSSGLICEAISDIRFPSDHKQFLT